ncbi:MAG: SDR family oxidoreductase [Caldilineae bacterium]|nr:MAG: SDR family oxidoreductase [Caldilineae bacterium]
MARTANHSQPSLLELISLKGKRALITGASSGMGAATARRFAEAGADLILLDIDEEGLIKVKRDLAPLPVDVEIHRIDLARKEEIDAFWENLEGPPPDILVNNAGIFPFQDYLSTDEAFMQRVMDVNFHAVYWMCQHFVRARKRMGGVIVNIGSIEAQVPFKKDLAHYTTGKAAVVALTRALAKDYGGKGFRANVIMPGGIITEGTKNAARGLLKMDFRLLYDGMQFLSRLPMGRLGQPDEVARISLVLASDLASYMNGAVIPVDGGFLSA